MPEIDTPLIVSGSARAFKRLFDLTLIVVGGVLLFPLLLLIALWIRLDSKGPALFTQERPGLHGRHFRIYKFRTMYCDAAARFDELPEALKQEFYRYGKIKNDPRVTRAGRFLRRTSLDELPQLLNVLHGTMSLIGPRAYLVEQIDQLASTDIVFQVKPGVSGLWQVSGRSDVSMKQRLRLDEIYVQEWSPMMDMRILWQTVGVVVRNEGAY